MRAALDIARGDLFDELGYVNAGRAAFGTGGIVTIQATTGFHQRSILCFRMADVYH